MSRRQHVVRTGDQAGVGTARSLGGCDIFCARQDCGEVHQGDHALIAPITVAATRNYKRCLVAATISNIGAWIPTGFTLTLTGSGTSSKVGTWNEQAHALGYTTLTLTGVTLDMNFHPNDSAYVYVFYEDYDVYSFSLAWGEGSYSTKEPYYNPPRDEVRNLHGPVLLDQTQFGPYGGLRNPGDPWYEPIDTYLTYPYLDLMAEPIVLQVDEYTGFGAEVDPDRCKIPGYDSGTAADCNHPDVTWSGSVTFHFAEAGDNVVIEME